MRRTKEDASKNFGDNFGLLDLAQGEPEELSGKDDNTCYGLKFDWNAGSGMKSGKGLTDLDDP